MTTQATPQAAGATLHLGGDAYCTPDLAPLLVPIDQLTPFPGNARRGDQDAITASIRDLGVWRAHVVQASTGHVIVGNHQLRGLLDLGATQAPASWRDCDDDYARAMAIRDNHTSDLGTYDQGDLLALYRATDQTTGLELAGLTSADLADLERALAAADYTPPVAAPTLAERFVVPPFTVLDARSGPWQERKRRWLALGIQSEVGRGEAHIAGGHSRGDAGGGLADLLNYDPEVRRVNDDARRTRKTLGAVQTNLDGEDAARYGRPDTRIKGMVSEKWNRDPKRVQEGRTLGQGVQAHRGPDGDLVYTETTAAGVSIFDPVLCELAYRWFAPPGGHVLDPFAGGSVRGIVAAALGLSYTGIELRPEQVAANDTQLPILDRIPAHGAISWHAGDSRTVLPTLDAPPVDLIFSCPPYADLEVYSDDPADLSNMPYDDFLAAYRTIIAAALDRLRPDRFAVWVIGEVRDRRGLYRGLVPDTIRAFTDAGAALYNEAILVTPVGSLPIRAGRQFTAGRKLGKTHQNVLVFCKGDPRAAADACGTVDVSLPDVEDADA